jgi:hypothetical protein
VNWRSAYWASISTHMIITCRPIGDVADSFRVRISNVVKKNYVTWVRERTIPTERPSLEGEVSANFCGETVPRGKRDGRILGFLDRNSYFSFLAPQLYSRGWVDSVPDPLLLRKSGSAGIRILISGICRQELWPLHHRGGLLSST